jgi:hypothetical protein
VFQKSWRGFERSYLSNPWDYGMDAKRIVSSWSVFWVFTMCGTWSREYQSSSSSSNSSSYSSLLFGVYQVRHKFWHFDNFLTTFWHFFKTFWQLFDKLFYNFLFSIFFLFYGNSQLSQQILWNKFYIRCAFFTLIGKDSLTHNRGRLLEKAAPKLFHVLPLRVEKRGDSRIMKQNTAKWQIVRNSLLISASAAQAETGMKI